MTGVNVDLEQALELERKVWEALRTGDRSLDESMLSEDFLGVYSSGFSDRAGHVDQLASGPTVFDYMLSEPQLVPLTDDQVILCYRADWRPPASDRPDRGGPARAMYISSIWARRDDGWTNMFSQDTPTEPKPDPFTS